MDRRGVERRKMFGDAYAALDALYKSNLPDEEKLAKKAEIIADLQKRSRMSRPINNATLIQSKTYNSGQEELERLLGACEGSFPRMIRTLERLKAEKLQPQESDVGKLIAQLGSDCAP
jgi:predicted aminopeptidase